MNKEPDTLVPYVSYKKKNITMIQRPGDVGKGMGFFIENRQTRRIRSFFGVTPGLIRGEVDGMLAESQTCGEKPTRYRTVIPRWFARPSPHHPRTIPRHRRCPANAWKRPAMPRKPRAATTLPARSKIAPRSFKSVAGYNCYKPRPGAKKPARWRAGCAVG